MISKAESTRVYSYLRFSSDAQGKEGKDSIRRQTLWRDKFMADHPAYVLDDTLHLLDEARSAYKDEHRREGALGLFLGEVKAGNVPPGSILLIEAIDRLTRLEPWDALEMVWLGLIKHGIIIQTQAATYDRDSMTNGQIHGLIAFINLAHNESKQKSERVRAARTRAFEAARNTGRIVTARCPAWLEVCDGKFHPVPEAKSTIKRIYKMKAEGHSQRHIERVLNDGVAWQRPNGWRTSYIKKILANAAVIGVYQPHRRGKDGKRKPEGLPIPDYYPAIIEPELFYTVQAQLEANRGKGGQMGKHLNIFRHITKCGYCGGAMRYEKKDSNGGRWRYQVCDNAARRAGCHRHTVRHAEVVDVVLRGCVYLRPEQVLPSDDEYAAKAAELRERWAGAVAELGNIEGQIENYTDQIGRTKTAARRDAYEAKIAKLEERAATLEVTKAEADTELAKLEHGAKDTVEWQRGVAGLMDAIQDDEAAETRAKLAAHLRTFIDRIEVFPRGFATVADPKKHYHEERGKVLLGKDGRRRRRAVRQRWDPAVDTIIETLDDAWADTPKPKPSMKEWAVFERYVLARRMSKEGRFYRVHFKTGERVDLVPPGGLATGWSNAGKGVESVLPDFGKLWQEFEEGRS